MVWNGIGNSELIAARHYLQTTDEDFETTANPSALAHIWPTHRATNRNQKTQRPPKNQCLTRACKQ